MSKSSTISKKPKNFRERTIKPRAFAQPLYARAGFTLFEIIIAMLVVGILSALAAPKVVDLVNEARRGDELNTVGNVKSGIALTYLGNVTRGITPQYPQNLDNATLAKASPSNPVYDLVLQHGITKSWEKLEQYRYRGPTGQEYEYDPTDGSFEAVAGGGEEPPPPPSTFIITFAGGGFNVLEGAFLTSDGNYIIGGQYGGGEAFYIAKVDSSGNILWENMFGGPGSEYAYEIQETSDGGYIMVGYTDSFLDPMGDIYLVKVGSDGAFQWEQVLGGGDFDEAYSVQQTSDNGYIIAGLTYSFTGMNEGYLIKTDELGVMQWDARFASGDLSSVQQTSDLGYILTGGSSFIKVDQFGTTQWELPFGGTSVSAQQTLDGSGYMVAGTTAGDFYLVKTNLSGDIQWEMTYGGADGDQLSSATQTSDEGYIMTGDTYSFVTGLRDIYLVKTDSSGTMEWERTYDVGQFAASVQEVPVSEGGGYMISGTDDNGNFLLIKTDANGTVQ